MLSIIGWWEVALACGVLILATTEFAALVAARRAGLTRNVSRLVTHGSLAVLSVFYAWVSIRWSVFLEPSSAAATGSRFAVANWGFLVLAGVLGLAVYEVVGHVWAMELGQTRSISRLVTRLAMANFIILMTMMNLTRWQIYRSEVLAGRDAAAIGGEIGRASCRERV